MAEKGLISIDVVNEQKENRSTSMEVGAGMSGGGSEKTPAKGK